MMKTKRCWTLCLATTLLISIVLRLPAQEDAAQQLERTRADLKVAATRATQEPARRARPSIPGDPAAAPQPPQLLPAYQQSNLSGFTNNQKQLFPNLYTGSIATSPYPGFDPELAKINHAANKQLVELVKKIKEASSEEAKLELKAEMKQVLTEQYDEYLNHHETPLKQLESRLEKLRAEFESRKKAKDDLVKLRLDTIWYETMGLGWPGSRQSTRGLSTWRQPAVPFASPGQIAPPSALAPGTPLPTGRDGFGEDPRAKTGR